MVAGSWRCRRARCASSSRLDGVGPLQVVEQDEAGTAAAARASAWASASSRRVRASSGVGSAALVAGALGAHLGQQAGEVAPPRRRERGEAAGDAGRPQRVGDRMERRRRRHLGEANVHHRAGSRAGRAGAAAPGLQREARLADPGLALDQDDGLVQRRELRELALAGDQRHLRQRRRRAPPEIAGAERRRAATARHSAGDRGRADALGQQAGLGQRLEPELVAQDPLAAVEQLERGAALAERVVQAHQLAIAGLLQRVVVEQLAVDRQRRAQVAAGLERACVRATRRCPLAQEALAPARAASRRSRRVVELEPFAERAGAQGERLRRAAVATTAARSRARSLSTPASADAVVVGDERVAQAGGAQPVQGAAQVAPCRRLVEAAPEQLGETRSRRRRPRREVDEQRQRLAHRQVHARARPAGCAGTPNSTSRVGKASIMAADHRAPSLLVDRPAAPPGHCASRKVPPTIR